MAKYNVTEVSQYLHEVVKSDMHEDEKFHILASNGVSMDRDVPPMFYVHGAEATCFFMENDELQSETIPLSEVDENLIIGRV